MPAACPRTRITVGALLLLAACQRTTGTLSDAQQQRFESERVVRRAIDLPMRRTHDSGARDAGWEESVASIVVTERSVAIHQRDYFWLEITPRSTGVYTVARDHERLSLRAGSGRSATSWSFRPPEDAAGWAADIRTVIAGTAGARRRERDER
ncbi:MAG: hypothetical protein IT293_07585 [Deltaproteobacteria bacterium]|nr:hypothetical protein [Deltaproteobacteria bacterium]